METYGGSANVRFKAKGRGRTRSRGDSTMMLVALFEGLGLEEYCGQWQIVKSVGEGGCCVWWVRTLFCNKEGLSYCILNWCAVC